MPKRKSIFDKEEEEEEEEEEKEEEEEEEEDEEEEYLPVLPGARPRPSRPPRPPPPPLHKSNCMSSSHYMASTKNRYLSLHQRFHIGGNSIYKISLNCTDSKYLTSD